MSTLIPLLQTIETIPDGLMDIAKANSAKNRYHNIYTCEAENAVVCMYRVGPYVYQQYVFAMHMAI